MSFVITMCVQEGIVMASESRLTLNTENLSGQKKVVQVAVGVSDSNYKTFLAPNNIGIATYGAADIKGVPIAGYIESFVLERLAEDQAEVDEVARRLLDHFRQFDPPPDAYFHVGGYRQADALKEQQVWQVMLRQNRAVKISQPGKQGASWGGEGDILTRLIQPVAEVDQKGKIAKQLPFYPIPWGFFTLQDAIDFCIFAVRSTIDAIRFQPRPKTVGGPIDVLVIKPDGAFWVQRKALHGQA